MMDITLFSFLAAVIIVFASAVLLSKNPIFSALSLAVTMVALAFMYYQLNAHFIAGVQLIVYAGAVMVLFVMVLMLFDLKTEINAFSGGIGSVMLKLSSCIGVVVVMGTTIKIGLAKNLVTSPTESFITPIQSVKAMSLKLFTDYVFAFEALGILLLLIAVGVVAVARSKGGTHD
jgi:NADH-quinone oxidoreductase subunit J